MAAPKSIGIAAGALLAAAVGCTQPGTQVTSAPAPVQQISVGPDGTIPVGTTVWVNLDRRLSARHNQVGDSFQATVAQDVVSYDGELLIPRGTQVSGHIAQLIGAPSPDQPGEIGLAFDAIDMEGARQPFAATIVQSEVPPSQGMSRVRGTDVLGGTAVGAVLGGLIHGGSGALAGAAIGAGAGTLISLGRGGNAELPAGTALQARIETPVRSYAAIHGRRRGY